MEKVRNVLKHPEILKNEPKSESWNYYEYYYISYYITLLVLVYKHKTFAWSLSYNMRIKKMHELWKKIILHQKMRNLWKKICDFQTWNE